MASELPIVAAIPLYGIAYCGCLRSYCCVGTVTSADQRVVNCMTKNEPNVEFNIGFRIFRIVAWITATTGCLALMVWLVAFAWSEVRRLF